MMLNLLPQPSSEPPAYAEAVARLASIRHALRLVEPFGAGPASDLPDDAIASAWDQAGEAKRRNFDRRSSQLVGAAAAGVEALLTERNKGREAHQAASQHLVEEIRRELADVARVILD